MTESNALEVPYVALHNVHKSWRETGFRKRRCSTKKLTLKSQVFVRSLFCNYLAPGPLFEQIAVKNFWSEWPPWYKEQTLSSDTLASKKDTLELFFWYALGF